MWWRVADRDPCTDSNPSTHCHAEADSNACAYSNSGTDRDPSAERHADRDTGSEQHAGTDCSASCL